VGQPTETKLELYDISGRCVRTLVNEQVTAGVHPVLFDGKDRSGQTLPSGIYFLRFETPEVLNVRQVTLLR
jgi:flagellar hook assembly protein FlgD